MKSRKTTTQELGLQASIAFFKSMASNQLDVGEAIAVIAPIKDTMLNVVIDTQSTEKTIETTIAAVKSFYHQHQKGWFWLVGRLSKPETLSQHLLNNDLSLDETFANCYFDLQKPLSSITIPDFIIKEANPEDELHDWSMPLRKAFSSCDETQSFRQLNASLPHGDNTSFHHYIGYFKNLPVCCGTLFANDDTVMIHNIGTDPNYTKRGFGTAMTVHAMMHAKKLGYQHCFLDASDQGLTVYEKIGFEIYSHTSIYSPNRERMETRL